MKLFKNKVGRPSNETLKKRKIFYLVVTIIIICLIGGIAVLLHFGGVNKLTGAATVSVTSVKLNKTSLTMIPGETLELSAIVSPSNATTKTVTWKSSNTKVVTVSNGVIKAVGTGSAKITVTTKDGSKAATSNVKVSKEANDVYDVVLFWGQSNMVGYSGVYTTASKYCNGKAGEDKLDYRIASNGGVSKFASLTGINQTIIQNYSAMNHVNVPINDGTVYDYVYCDSNNDNKCSSNPEGLIKVNKDTARIGQLLYAKNAGQTFYQGVSTVSGQNYYSIMSSYGTNMTQWFSYQHYKNTGHKVIVVLAANGGEKLNHFLPHSNSTGCNNFTSTTCTTDNQYIYEAMVKKYNAAINYLKSKNYTIGNKFHVLFQGESDAGSTTTTDQWVNMYNNINNNLKKDLGTSFGVIVETAREVGNKNYDGVVRIHNAQEKVIKNNSNVILGSSYPYDRFVPDEANYKKYYMNHKIYKNMSYSAALNQAKLSASISKCYNNTIHFNSAALSQIGLESANNVYKYLKNNGYIQTVSPTKKATTKATATKKATTTAQKLSGSCKASLSTSGSKVTYTTSCTGNAKVTNIAYKTPYSNGFLSRGDKWGTYKNGTSTITFASRNIGKTITIRVYYDLSASSTSKTHYTDQTITVGSNASGKLSGSCKAALSTSGTKVTYKTSCTGNAKVTNIAYKTPHISSFENRGSGWGAYKAGTSTITFASSNKGKTVTIRVYYDTSTSSKSKTHYTDQTITLK